MGAKSLGTKTSKINKKVRNLGTSLLRKEIHHIRHQGLNLKTKNCKKNQRINRAINWYGLRVISGQKLI